MTLTEAKRLRYGQIVYIKGAYDADGSPSKCKVTGKVQTWKRSPGRVRVPVKRGLYDYGAITEHNLERFTLKQPASKKRSKRKRSKK